MNAIIPGKMLFGTNGTKVDHMTCNPNPIPIPIPTPEKIFKIKGNKKRQITKSAADEIKQ